LFTTASLEPKLGNGRGQVFVGLTEALIYNIIDIVSYFQGKIELIPFL
jgi:hypothetical protein